MLALISPLLLLASSWPQSTATKWGITGSDEDPVPVPELELEPDPDAVALSSPDSTSTKRLLARRFNILISSTRAKSIQGAKSKGGMVPARIGSCNICICIRIRIVGDRLEEAPRNYASVTNTRNATLHHFHRWLARLAQKKYKNQCRTMAAHARNLFGQRDGASGNMPECGMRTDGADDCLGTKLKRTSERANSAGVGHHRSYAAWYGERARERVAGETSFDTL